MDFFSEDPFDPSVDDVCDRILAGPDKLQQEGLDLESFVADETQSVVDTSPPPPVRIAVPFKKAPRKEVGTKKASRPPTEADASVTPVGKPSAPISTNSGSMQTRTPSEVDPMASPTAGGGSHSVALAADMTADLVLTSLESMRQRLARPSIYTRSSSSKSKAIGTATGGMEPPPPLPSSGVIDSSPVPTSSLSHADVADLLQYSTANPRVAKALEVQRQEMQRKEEVKEAARKEQREALQREQEALAKKRKEKMEAEKRQSAAQSSSVPPVVQVQQRDPPAAGISTSDQDSIAKKVAATIMQSTALLERTGTKKEEQGKKPLPRAQHIAMTTQTQDSRNAVSFSQTEDPVPVKAPVLRATGVQAELEAPGPTMVSGGIQVGENERKTFGAQTDYYLPPQRLLMRGEAAEIQKRIDTEAVAEAIALANIRRQQNAATANLSASSKKKGKGKATKQSNLTHEAQARSSQNGADQLPIEAFSGGGLQGVVPYSNVSRLQDPIPGTIPGVVDAPGSWGYVAPMQPDPLCITTGKQRAVVDDYLPSGGGSSSRNDTSMMTHITQQGTLHGDSAKKLGDSSSILIPGKYPAPDPFGGTPGDFTGALVKDAVMKGLVHECVATAIKEDVESGRWLVDRTNQFETSTTQGSVMVADEVVPAEHVSVFVGDAIREYLERSPIVIPPVEPDVGPGSAGSKATQSQLLDPPLKHLGLEKEQERGQVEESLASLLVESLVAATYPPPAPEKKKPAPVQPTQDKVKVPTALATPENSVTPPVQTTVQDPVASPPLQQQQDIVNAVLQQVRAEWHSQKEREEFEAGEQQARLTSIVGAERDAFVDLIMKKTRQVVAEPKVVPAQEDNAVRSVTETTVSVVTPLSPSSMIPQPKTLNEPKKVEDENKSDTSAPVAGDGGPKKPDVEVSDTKEKVAAPTEQKTVEESVSSPHSPPAGDTTLPPSPTLVAPPAGLVTSPPQLTSQPPASPSGAPPSNWELKRLSWQQEEQSARWAHREEESTERSELRSFHVASVASFERQKLQLNYAQLQEDLSHRQREFQRLQQEQHQQLMLAQQQTQQQVAANAAQVAAQPTPQLAVQPIAQPPVQPVVQASVPPVAPGVPRPQPDSAAKIILEWCQRVEEQRGPQASGVVHDGRALAVVTQGTLDLPAAGPVYRCVDDMLAWDEDDTVPSSDTHLSSFDSKGGHRFINYGSPPQAGEQDGTQTSQGTSLTDTTMTTMTATSTNTSMTSVFSDGELADAVRGLDQVDAAFARMQYQRRGYIRK